MIYLTAEICRESGCKEREILTYLDRGYVKASVRSASGHGSRRIWNDNDLAKVRWLKKWSHLLRVDVLRDLEDHHIAIARELTSAASDIAGAYK